MRLREGGGKEEDGGATTVTLGDAGKGSEENGGLPTWWDRAGGCNRREVHSRWGIPLTDRFIARNLHPVPPNDGDCTRPRSPARNPMQRRSRPSVRLPARPRRERKCSGCGDTGAEARVERLMIVRRALHRRAPNARANVRGSRGFPREVFSRDISSKYILSPRYMYNREM